MACPIGPFSLEDAILLGLRDNPTLQHARFDQVLSRYALVVARSAYRPQWSLKASLGEQHAFSNQAQTDAALLPSMHYKNRWGTSVDVQSSTHFESPVTGDRVMSSSTQLSVTQALLRGGGAVAAYAWLDAKATARLDRLHFKEAVMSQILTITQAYHTWVGARSGVQIQRAAMRDASHQLAVFELKERLGKVAKADVLAQRAQLASQRLALASSEAAADDSQLVLLRLLGVDGIAAGGSSCAWQPMPGSVQAARAMPTLQQAERMALANSVHYQSARLAREQATRGVELAKRNGWWQMDLQASARFDHGDGRGSETRSRTGDKSLVLHVSVPVADVTIKQQRVAAEVALSKATLNLKLAKQDVQQAVRHQLRTLRDLKARMALAEEAVRLAKLNLNHAKLKLQHGRVDAFEVTSLRADLTSAQLAALRERMAYQDQLATWSHLLGRILDDWHLSWRAVQ